MSHEPRFDPMRELQNLGEQISKTVEKGIRSMTSGPAEFALDMYQVDEELRICTQAIDGLVKDSIEISLEADVLTIGLRSEPQATPTTAVYHLQECRFGPMTRHVELPCEVFGQEARARVDSGNRLHITLPINSEFGKIQMTPVE